MPLPSNELWLHVRSGYGIELTCPLNSRILSIPQIFEQSLFLLYLSVAPIAVGVVPLRVHHQPEVAVAALLPSPLVPRDLKVLLVLGVQVGEDKAVGKLRKKKDCIVRYGIVLCLCRVEQVQVDDHHVHVL